MTNRSFDPAPAARRLADLWRGFRQIDSLPEAERPRDVADGYAIQRELMRIVDEPVRGYKLGLSSAAAMERTGLGMPIVGFVPGSRLHRSGASVDVPAAAVLLEVEVALRIPAGWADGEPMAPEAHLAFEVVCSRFVDRRAVGLPSFVGDDSGFHALVVGDPVPLDRLDALLAAGASLHRDSETVAGPATGRECPDPLEVLDRFRMLARE
ncbi:MAG: hydratase, partial [Thermomicrobiales bacterium]|nr:hydratase [Thermomicrobiales bacterium]